MKVFRWEVAQEDLARFELAQRLGQSPLIGQIANNRGIYTPEQYQAFINPSLRMLHDPFTMGNMKMAAERIVAAIKAKEKIIVYGDYDVDGITGTVTLMMAIKMYGGDVDFHVPHRIDEGYGLHEDSLKVLIEGGAKLVVSVDCGISGIKPAAFMKEAGVDLIITDHHEAKETFPEAYCIVHPRYHVTPGSTTENFPSEYPNHDLCGSGVAFKLAWAIGRTLSGGARVSDDTAPFFAHAVAFTALGTIADVVPLRGENRVIAQEGMRRIPQTCFAGLRALVASARLDGEEIDGYKVGFTLGPRLNAAGRMGHARRAIKMFTEENYAAAYAIAEQLDLENTNRQALEKKMFKQADEQFQAILLADKPSDVIIVQDDPPASVAPTWHKGIMGIVASRLTEKYHKPSIVFVRDGGSGRSIEGFNLIAAVKHCEEYLTMFGGHAAACGLHIRNGCLESFRNSICDYARRHQTPEMQNPCIKIECRAKLAEMTEAFTLELTKIGPFGNGNRRPFFLFENVSVKDVRHMGKEGQFLSFIGIEGETAIKCVWFKPTPAVMSGLVNGMSIDIVGEPSLNEWKGNTSVQVMIRDLKFHVASDKSEPGLL